MLSGDGGQMFSGWGEAEGIPGDSLGKEAGEEVVVEGTRTTRFFGDHPQPPLL